jgi:signal peptidase II
LKLIAPHSVAERRVLRRTLVLAGLLLVLDQASKVVVEQLLAGRPAVAVIPGCFDLVYVTNRGAAWGLFHDLAAGRWLLLLVSAAVMGLVAWQFRALADGRPERFYALGLVLTGIFGNGIDRFRRGAVVDFVDWHLGTWHWPAFNVADSAICVGVAVFILSSLLRSAPPEEKSEILNPKSEG